MNWLMLGALLLTLAGIDFDAGASDPGSADTAMAAQPGDGDGTVAVQFGGGGIPGK